MLRVCSWSGLHVPLPRGWAHCELFLVFLCGFVPWKPLCLFRRPTRNGWNLISSLRAERSGSRSSVSTQGQAGVTGVCQMLQMPVVGAQTSLPGEERGLPCYCSFQGLCTETCPLVVHLHSLPLPGEGAVSPLPCPLQDSHMESGQPIRQSGSSFRANWAERPLALLLAMTSVHTPRLGNSTPMGTPILSGLWEFLDTVSRVVSAHFTTWAHFRQGCVSPDQISKADCNVGSVALPFPDSGVRKLPALPFTWYINLDSRLESPTLQRVVAFYWRVPAILLLNIRWDS